MHFAIQINKNETTQIKQETKRQPPIINEEMRQGKEEKRKRGKEEKRKRGKEEKRKRGKEDDEVYLNSNVPPAHRHPNPVTRKQNENKVKKPLSSI